MITDLDAANLCQSLYNDEKAFDFIGSIEDVDFAIKEYPDCTALVFEGSHNLTDWANDFDAHMVPAIELNGALVHHGFYRGLSAMLVRTLVKLAKDKPVYCIGHSLGAGRAHIFGGMLIVAGYHIEVVTFGSPRPGDKKLADILEPFPNRSYWNYHDEWNHDIVGDVPVAITPLFQFLTPRERIKVSVQPEATDPWGHIMGWHHLKYYIQGLSA